MINKVASSMSLYNTGKALPKTAAKKQDSAMPQDKVSWGRHFGSGMSRNKLKKIKMAVLGTAGAAAGVFGGITLATAGGVVGAITLGVTGAVTGAAVGGMIASNVGDTSGFGGLAKAMGGAIIGAVVGGIAGVTTAVAAAAAAPIVGGVTGAIAGGAGGLLLSQMKVSF